ncbi:MAG: BadF/BadG/BcrA/BcrD ATPase family protein [Euryarchaeota archaeon]|nr:BadF/BadG/BcrA/BcrD ATPase family protein [Euryarchaeota archaeon]
MIVGIDIGGTTTDAVAIKNHKILKIVSVTANDPLAAASGALGKLVTSLDKPLDEIRTIAATGGGSRFLKDTLLGVPVKHIDEITAIGKGGITLAEKKQGVVVSMGTGTAVACVKDEIRHFGGSGIGGGTLQGLSRMLLNISNIQTLDDLAERGNLKKVDLTVGDIAGGSVGVIPSDATASNFGKIDDTVEKEDIAKGIINMVSQTVGVIAIFAARACGLNDVIFTGKGMALSEVRQSMHSIQPLFDKNFIIPERGEYATAIGAAVAILNGE